MRKIFNVRFFTKGFTLIELLIVITILGVLAAGVLVAINPVKKINQAKDAQIKADIGQVLQAVQAYATLNSLNGASYPSQVSDLIANGDLKLSPATPIFFDATPSGCSPSGTKCTSVAVYASLKDVSASNNYWCWDSTNNVASYSTTAPVTGTGICSGALSLTASYSGGVVTVTWSGVASPNLGTHNWLASAHPSDSNNTYDSSHWVYDGNAPSCTMSLPSTTKTNGTCTMTAPTAAGTYEVRLFVGDNDGTGTYSFTIITRSSTFIIP